MSNDFFNHTGTIAKLSVASSSEVNALFAAVAAGFEKLPSETNLNRDTVTYVVDTGSANALEIALDPILTAYADGLKVRVKIAATNTGPATLDIDSLGAISIKRQDNTDPEATDLTAGEIAEFIYVGSTFYLVTQAKTILARAGSGTDVALSRLIADLATLKASTDAFTVGTRVETVAEGYRYEVVASGAHVTTAGGAQLKVLPDAAGTYHALAISSGDIGADVNTLFAEFGEKTHVHVGPGTHTLSTTINMNSSVGSHLVLSGESHITTTLTMPAGSEMIGVNAQSQDESTIRDIRIIEGSGSLTCLCFLVGGTSATMQRVWAGNAKTGFVNLGSNAHWNDCRCEACDHGMIIASRFADFEVGMTAANAAVTGGSFHQLHLHNCGRNNASRLAGLFVTRFKQANISGVSGTFQVGETVTGGTSGATGVIYSSNGTTTLILDQPGVFTASETITGGTSGATATVDSTNSNVIRGLNFTGLALTENDRNGAIIEGVVGAQLQGRAQRNGTDATDDAAGVRIGVGAQVSIDMDMLDNGPQAGGHSGLGYGLYLDSTATDAIVSANGGSWTCSQATDQDYGFRMDAGTFTLAGVDVAGNQVAAYYGASLHRAVACNGITDEYHDPARAKSWRTIGNTLEEWGEGQSRTDGTGGLTITFTKEFARVPQVFLTAHNGGGINIELIAPQTATGFNGIVRSNSTNAAMATAVYFQWYAIGEWDGVS